MAEDSLNKRALTTVLHQHPADTPGEEAAFAVMAEHSLNSYNTRCDAREIDRLKQVSWVCGIVGGIAKEAPCMGQMPSVCIILRVEREPQRG